MKLTYKIVLLLFIISFQNLFSIPNIDWIKCYGGEWDDYFSQLIPTYDGGYFLVGDSYNIFGQVEGNHGNSDIWVVQVNQDGGMLWRKCLGGSDVESLPCAQQLSDGSFIVTCMTKSNDGDVSGNHGNRDIWVTKIYPNGGIEWAKCIGGSDDDVPYSIIQTNDDGYMIAAGSNSIDGDVRGNHGEGDGVLVKLSSTGDIEWLKCYGSTGNESFTSVRQSIDCGFIAIGSSYNSENGNHGLTDVYVVKVNEQGNVEWQKCIGGTENEEAFDVKIDEYNDYIIAGRTSSYSGDVVGNHNFSVDGWLVKLDQNGKLLWQKCFGGSAWDAFESVYITNDGGYILFGNTESSNGDVSGKHGDSDAWVVKVDSTLTIEWQLCIGGVEQELGETVLQDTDGNFILGGNTRSLDRDFNINHGGYDYFLVKILTQKDSTVINKDFLLFPNPSKNLLNISIRKELIGKEYMIYNSIGQLITSNYITKNFFKIDICNLPIGAYYLKIGNFNQMFIKK